jgi:hypothetical protein
MLDFGISMSSWFVATFFPAFTGVFLTSIISRKIDRRFVSSFAIGVFLWFFVDTLGGSANLDVNSGFSGGLPQISVVLLFVLGLLLFFSIGSNSFNDKVKYSLLVPFLVSIAMGIHGLGEGAAFGGTASQTSSTDLVGAFGGFNAAVAYVLHKVLEPVVIGAVYASFNSSSRYSVLIRDSIFLSLVFSFTSLVGAISGYFLQYDSTYMFAVGAGASVYPLAVLARNSFASSLGGREAFKISLSIALGLLTIYIAALFHS